MKSSLPKVLHPLLGRPMLEWVLEAVRPLGPERVTVVSSAEERLLSYLREKGLRVVIQRERLGTGHAVMMAQGELEGFQGTSLVLYGDTPLLRPETLKGLLEHHLKTSATLTILGAVLEDPSGYGRILRDGKGKPIRILEDVGPNSEGLREVNVGVYAVRTPFLLEALRVLEPTNRQSEYYLTDIVEVASRKGERVEVFWGEPEEAIGVNTRADLARAVALLRRRILERWMLEGVTIEDPQSTWIEPKVVIGPDTVIRPNCFLRGRTTIGRGCVIGPDVEIIDSELGDGVEVRFCSHLEGSRISSGATIGPFSRLRPGTELEEGVRVGNFVEVKNSRLGMGTKANHLAYIGDAEVGEEVNIGAGTITCNYDGVRKHKTIIGSKAFIGSNVSLVAPVKVGEEATIGAGSVITKEVPPLSLAVERAKQRILPGWAKRRKK